MYLENLKDEKFFQEKKSSNLNSISILPKDCLLKIFKFIYYLPISFASREFLWINNFFVEEVFNELNKKFSFDENIINQLVKCETNIYNTNIYEHVNDENKGKEIKDENYKKIFIRAIILKKIMNLTCKLLNLQSIKNSKFTELRKSDLEKYSFNFVDNIEKLINDIVRDPKIMEVNIFNKRIIMNGKIKNYCSKYYNKIQKIFESKFFIRLISDKINNEVEKISKEKKLYDFYDVFFILNEKYKIKNFTLFRNSYIKKLEISFSSEILKKFSDGNFSEEFNMKNLRRLTIFTEYFNNDLKKALLKFNIKKRFPSLIFLKVKYLKVNKNTPCEKTIFST